MGGLPGATELFYNASGNLLPLNGMTLVYDESSQLTSVTGGLGGTATYVYDVFGRRASKSVGGQTTWFIYDGDSPLAESDAQGNLSHAYTWGPMGLLSDALINGQGQSQSRFTLADESGDIRELVDAHDYDTPTTQDARVDGYENSTPSYST